MRGVRIADVVRVAAGGDLVAVTDAVVIAVRIARVGAGRALLGVREAVTVRIAAAVGLARVTDVVRVAAGGDLVAVIDAVVIAVGVLDVGPGEDLVLVRQAVIVEVGAEPIAVRGHVVRPVADAVVIAVRIERVRAVAQLVAVVDPVGVAVRAGAEAVGQDVVRAVTHAVVVAVGIGRVGARFAAVRHAVAVGVGIAGIGLARVDHAVAVFVLDDVEQPVAVAVHGVGADLGGVAGGVGGGRGDDLTGHEGAGRRQRAGEGAVRGARAGAEIRAELAVGDGARVPDLHHGVVPVVERDEEVDRVAAGERRPEQADEAAQRKVAAGRGHGGDDGVVEAVVRLAGVQQAVVGRDAVARVARVRIVVVGVEVDGDVDVVADDVAPHADLLGGALHGDAGAAVVRDEVPFEEDRGARRRVAHDDGDRLVARGDAVGLKTAARGGVLLQQQAVEEAVVPAELDAAAALVADEVSAHDVVRARLSRREDEQHAVEGERVPAVGAADLVLFDERVGAARVPADAGVVDAHIVAPNDDAVARVQDADLRGDLALAAVGAHADEVVLHYGAVSADDDATVVQREPSNGGAVARELEDGVVEVELELGPGEERQRVLVTARLEAVRADAHDAAAAEGAGVLVANGAERAARRVARAVRGAVEHQARGRVGGERRLDVHPPPGAGGVALVGRHRRHEAHGVRAADGVGVREELPDAALAEAVRRAGVVIAVACVRDDVVAEAEVQAADVVAAGDDDEGQVLAPRGAAVSEVVRLISSSAAVAGAFGGDDAGAPGAVGAQRPTRTHRLLEPTGRAAAAHRDPITTVADGEGEGAGRGGVGGGHGIVVAIWGAVAVVVLVQAHLDVVDAHGVAEVRVAVDVEQHAAGQGRRAGGSGVGEQRERAQRYRRRPAHGHLIAVHSARGRSDKCCATARARSAYRAPAASSFFRPMRVDLRRHPPRRTLRGARQRVTSSQAREGHEEGARAARGAQPGKPSSRVSP